MSETGLPELAGSLVMEQRTAVTEQIARVRDMAQVSSVQQMEAEAAVLNALGSRVVDAATASLSAQMAEATAKMQRTGADLVAQIDAFTAATNEGSAAMNRWTRNMAIATWVLVIVTSLQVLLTVYGHDFQILVMPR